MTRRYTARVEITPLKKGETLWLQFDSDGRPVQGQVINNKSGDVVVAELRARGGPRVSRHAAQKGGIPW